MAVISSVASGCCNVGSAGWPGEYIFCNRTTFVFFCHCNFDYETALSELRPARLLKAVER